MSQWDISDVSCSEYKADDATICFVHVYLLWGWSLISLRVNEYLCECVCQGAALREVWNTSMYAAIWHKFRYVMHISVYLCVLAYIHLCFIIWVCVCHSGRAICVSSTSKVPSPQKYLADKLIIESIWRRLPSSILFCCGTACLLGSGGWVVDQGCRLLCFLYADTHTHTDTQYVRCLMS